MSITTETKVGVLVLAAAAGLSWLSLQSGLIGNGSIDDMRELESAFNNAEGIVIGSDVKMAGVTVGEVTNIRLTPDGTAIVSFIVDPDVPLASNVRAQVASSGLIGEKFLGLVTDFGAEGRLPADAATIPSAGSTSVENIATNFARVSDDLEEITAALRSSLGGPENAQKLSNIVNGLEGAFTRLDVILNDEIQQDQIGSIVDGLASFSSALKNDGDEIIGDVKASMKSLRTILGSNEQQASEMIKNLSVASENLATITARLERGEGTLGKLMTEENGTMIDDFAAAAADIRAISQKINTGEGTLGRLINDPTTADKIETALDNFSGFAERVEAFRTEVDFNGYMLPSEEISKGNFSVTLAPRPTRYYVIGVHADGFTTEAERADGNPSFRGQDFGDNMKVTAQFGHVFQNAVLGHDMGFRIGLKNSTFGLGADFKNIDLPFVDYTADISADLYDFAAENLPLDSEENPHLDITTKVNLVDRTLYAVGGYDNVLSEKYGSPFIGLGFRFQDDDLKYLMSQAGGAL